MCEARAGQMGRFSGRARPCRHVVGLSLGSLSSFILLRSLSLFSVSCHVHADTMDWLRSRSGAIFPRRGVCWHCIVCCITVVYHMHYFHNCDPNRPNHRVSPAIHVPCQLMIIDLVRFRGCPVRCCLGNVRISRNGVPSSYPRSDSVRGWENPSARLY